MRPSAERGALWPLQAHAMAARLQKKETSLQQETTNCSLFGDSPYQEVF